MNFHLDNGRILYSCETYIHTKYAPDYPNLSSTARTDGFVVFPLEGKVTSLQALCMIDWIKDGPGHVLAQLAIQYKRDDYPFAHLTRKLNCDIVTASTVNLVLGVHMPVFGLAIHQGIAGAYICEAKPVSSICVLMLIPMK